MTDAKDNDFCNDNIFIQSVRLKSDIGIQSRNEYPIRQFAFPDGMLNMDKNVTFFVGDNGVGKSTVIEAIAIACGFNAEGGTRNSMFSTHDNCSELYKHLNISRGHKRPSDGFFLRAESFYNFATYMEEQGLLGLYRDAYGSDTLHGLSHGESFLSVVTNRFFGDGLYILDEPEAALSLSGQLTFMRLMHELVTCRNSQFIISTHSPILIAYPTASIWQFTGDEINLVPYKETELYTQYKQLLNSDRTIHYLLDD